jgi:sporulation protein YabP
MSVTGVEQVDSFDENEISVFTSEGNLTVSGTELHIDKLDLEAGELIITGFVTDITYEEVAKASSLWTKLFTK